MDLLVKDLEKVTVQECFEEQLLEVGIEKYEVEGMYDATFEMVKAMKDVLRHLTKKLLEGQIRSVEYKDNQTQKPEHVRKINELNWSHSITPFKGKNGK